MKRPTALLLAFASIVTIAAAGASISQGAEANTNCWDEYDLSGSEMYRTVVSADIPLEDCTPGEGCYFGYSRSDGTRDRQYVPHGMNPADVCVDATTTTTVNPTTTVTPTTPSVPPVPAQRFETLPVGAVLPSDAECAAAVRPTTENRPDNSQANNTPGTDPNNRFPRVTGAFTGTTDEIIQWNACKWGIDEDIVRAQIVAESYWNQSAIGDFTSRSERCAPGNPIGDYPPQFAGDADHGNECPESVGLGQVRWTYHQSAFEDDNALLSSAYNLDYTYAVWRSCFEGELGWLNNVDRGRDYAAGDAEGCLGVWFSGRWYTADAEGYLERVRGYMDERTWGQAQFPPAIEAADPTPPVTTLPPTTLPPTTVTPTTVVAPTTSTTTTTVPPTTTTTTTIPLTTTTTTTTTVPPATTTTTTVPSTTTPSTTTPRSGGSFVATFDDNGGLDAFDRNVWHRDNFVSNQKWTGDHDLNCGSPDTQRVILRSDPEDAFYTCKDHMMTSIGHVSGYSIGWFSPKQTFNGQDTVSVDVNSTFLGTRQWFEISLVPVDYDSGVDGCEVCITGNTALSGFFPSEQPDNTFVFGTQSGGGRIMVDNVNTRAIPKLCRDANPLDPEGCASKPIRRTWAAEDNNDGTVTITISDSSGVEVFGEVTMPGSFPTGDWRLVVKDHNYTPLKSGPVAGHTWHWDNIIVR